MRVSPSPRGPISICRYKSNKGRKTSGLGFHIPGERRKRGFRGEVEKIWVETNILSRVHDLCSPWQSTDERRLNPIHVEQDMPTAPFAILTTTNPPQPLPKISHHNAWFPKKDVKDRNKVSEANCTSCRVIGFSSTTRVVLMSATSMRRPRRS